MEAISWTWILILIIVVGVLLFVFMYTLNRKPSGNNPTPPVPQSGFTVTDVNVGDNTISFYGDPDVVNIYIRKENTEDNIYVILNFNVEANTNYTENCIITLADLQSGTYGVGYNSDGAGSGGPNLYTFTV